MERRWKVLLLTSVGSFMAFLDAPVVSVAFPDIQKSFSGTSAATLAWTLDAYFIAFAAFLVVAGRLADRVGRRNLFLAGMGLFTVASLVCAVAPTAGVLITGRTVQALGAAAVVPAGQGLMLGEFPPHERKTAVGVLAAIIGLATAASPAVGGVIVDQLGWRWIFYLSLAVGLGTIAWAMSLLRRDERPAEKAPFPDAIGAVLQAGALAFLVLAILKGDAWGWGDARTVGSFAIAAVALPLFFLRSRGHRAAVIDFGLFRDRTFAVANVASLIYAIGFYAVTIEAVLYFTGVWHWSVLETGLAFIPGSILGAVLGGPAGKIAERRGPRGVTIVGAALSVVGVGYIVLRSGSHSHYVTDWLPGQLLLGPGVTIALTGLVGAALTSAPPAAFALASGINSALRQVGGAIGVALVVAITSSSGGSPVSRGHAAFVVAAAALLVGGAIAALMRPRPRPSPSRPVETAEPAAAGAGA